MNAIEISNLSKIYRKGFWGIKVPAVVDVSFSIKKGVITGFVGPNGAGKTTTIKSIMGLVRPDRGSIKIENVDSVHHFARKGVAYLSEQPYFYGHLTVRESLQFTANLIGIDSADRNKEIDDALDTVELSHKTKSKVKEMSKGMQQRLNMAQALLGKPHLMILDEPMSGMDPPGRRLFRSLFKQLVGSGTTIFFSTHVLEDIESVCDEVIVVSKGTVTYAGGVRELLSNGLLGVELSIGACDTEVQECLRERGCQVQEGVNGKLVVVVPRELSAIDIQKYLSTKEIFPERVVSRTMSLEDLLYGKNAKDANL